MFCLKKIIVVIIVLIFCNCKKSRLNNEFSKLSGTWVWINGFDDNSNSAFILTLEVKGKYHLCNGNKKVEYGRLIKEDNTLKFISNDILKNYKMTYMNGKSLKYFKNDSLIITKIHLTDQPVSYYKKK